MPWGIKKQNNQWIIYRKDTGAVVGHSKSKQDAAISVAIREKAAKEKGEQLSNMSQFVKAINLREELKQQMNFVFVKK